MPIIRNESDIQRGLEALVALDPALEPIVEKAGPVPLRLLTPGFEGLAQIIVSQVVTKAAAAAIWGRMGANSATSASGYLACQADEIASFGLSRAKIACLQGAAEAVESGALDLDGLASLPVEEALMRLMALKGVGAWTAEVYLMVCLGHADLFPAGDVALRAAVGRGLQLSGRPDIRETARIALRWQPWRSVAARLFWAYYAADAGRDAIVAD